MRSTAITSAATRRRRRLRRRGGGGGTRPVAVGGGSTVVVMTAGNPPFWLDACGTVGDRPIHRRRQHTEDRHHRAERGRGVGRPHTTAQRAANTDRDAPGVGR